MTTVDSWSDGASYELDARSRSQGTWLPAGRYYRHLSQLKYLLGRSARWHARLAIRLFVSEDADELLQAATSAGSAVELLVKAYLSTVNTSLLAERGDRDTVLLLCGRSAQAKINILSMRTISANDALRLVTQLHPAFPPFDQQPPILRARNSALHMALVDSSELRSAIVQMARMIESLLAALDLDRGKFWGTYATQVVDSLLDEAAKELEQVIAAKIAAARSRLDALVANASPEGAEAILAALSGRPMSGSDHEEAQKCPVCDQQGWLICAVEEGEIRYETDEDGFSSTWADRTAFPFSFECPVCGLELAVDELAEFDFPRSIELEPAERNPDPDEDLWRDR